MCAYGNDPVGRENLCKKKKREIAGITALKRRESRALRQECEAALGRSTDSAFIGTERKQSIWQVQAGPSEDAEDTREFGAVLIPFRFFSVIK